MQTNEIQASTLTQKPLIRIWDAEFVNLWGSNRLVGDIENYPTEHNLHGGIGEFRYEGERRNIITSSVVKSTFTDDREYHVETQRSIYVVQSWKTPPQ